MGLFTREPWRTAQWKKHILQNDAGLFTSDSAALSFDLPSCPRLWMLMREAKILPISLANRQCFGKLKRPFFSGSMQWVAALPMRSPTEASHGVVDRNRLARSPCLSCLKMWKVLSSKRTGKRLRSTGKMIGKRSTSREGYDKTLGDSSHVGRRS